MTQDDDGGFSITGEANVHMASILALRAALSLEVKGMTRRGRSARTIAQEFLGLPGRPTARTVYKALNAYIVEQLGANFDKPLNS
jgi:hypothetical protein